MAERLNRTGNDASRQAHLSIENDEGKAGVARRSPDTHGDADDDLRETAPADETRQAIRRIVCNMCLRGSGA